MKMYRGIQESSVLFFFFLTILNQIISNRPSAAFSQPCLTELKFWLVAAG